MPLVRVPAPYDFVLSTERFRAWGPDRANLWHDEGLHRVIGGREVRIEAIGGGVLVEPYDAEIEEVVSRLIGLPFDLDAFYEGITDPTLARVAESMRGFRPTLTPDSFESLVTSITAQQVSMYSAIAIRNRLIDRYGVGGGLARGFPTRERIAAADEADLVDVGFSRRKAEYVVGLARTDLPWDEFDTLSDAEVRAILLRVRGLGEWTAQWFLARHLARPHAWPAGDLALRKAVQHFYGDVDVHAISDRFEPFQNLAAHYLMYGLRLAA
jgi:3-methyladenine DNA glycosylase/8-oxoguanine DNA glycosylase